MVSKECIICEGISKLVSVILRCMLLESVLWCSLINSPCVIFPPERRDQKEGTSRRMMLLLYLVNSIVQTNP